jgi:hypothetical protein
VLTKRERFCEKIALAVANDETEFEIVLNYVDRSRWTVCTTCSGAGITEAQAKRRPYLREGRIIYCKDCGGMGAKPSKRVGCAI